MICGNISNFFSLFWVWFSFLFFFFPFSSLICPPLLCFGPLRILRLKEIEAIDSLTFSCFTNASHYLKIKPKKPKFIIASARWPEAVAGSAGVSRMRGKAVFCPCKARPSSGRPNR